MNIYIPNVCKYVIQLYINAKKGYRNVKNILHQPSTYVPQHLTFDNKSFYPLMSSQQRDERLGTLLNKEKEIREEMDIIEAEATTNKNDMEHNKKIKVN